MIPTILCMVIDVCAIFAPPNFFDPISSFATRGYEKPQLGCLSHEREQTKNLKATYRRVQTLEIS